MVVDQNTKINFQVVVLIVTAAVSVGMMYQRQNNTDQEIRDVKAELITLNSKMDKYIFDTRIGSSDATASAVTVAD